MNFKSSAIFCVIVFIGLLALSAFSFAAYLVPGISRVVLWLIVLSAFIISLKRIDYGLYIMLAELAVGGYGHLFVADGISLRVGLFFALLTALVINLFLKMYQAQVRPGSTGMLPYAFLTLGLAVILGLTVGMTQNSWPLVILDGNAWLFFLLWPAYWQATGRERFWQNIFPILLTASAFLSLKTIFTLIIFSHHFTDSSGTFYQWLRDAGLGEITPMSGNLFRVFFQSQIYCLLAFFVVLAWLLLRPNLSRRQFLAAGFYLYLTGLAIVISQSRSFWLGGLAGIFLLLWLIAWWGKKKLTYVFLAGLALAVMIASQFLAVSLLSGSYFGNRFANLQAEPASVSRLNQLEPLTSAIASSPFFGHGFGKTLTYVSHDPRILARNPEGLFTTFAFEWGYLDIALKIGGLGLGLYLFLIASIAFIGLKNMKSSKSHDCYLSAGLLAALTALVVTNFFSPYLNHPLGINYLMLIAAYYGRK